LIHRTARRPRGPSRREPAGGSGAAHLGL